MSGNFRDSFTKDDAKDDILGYDDTAFHYFVITILVCVATPWTLSAVFALIFPGEAKVQRRFPKKSSSGRTFHYCATSAMVAKVDDARRRARSWTRRSGGLWLLQAVILSSLWVAIWTMVLHLRTSGQKEINRFDPFALLDVSPDASGSQIRRAYRKLSLAWHPDKNPDDPLAASRFIQITKAYSALTDDISRRNWEKYGNPDGPQTTKIGIGLPRILLQKEKSLQILCAFFFAIIIVIPVSFIWHYSNTLNYAANGVLIETLQFLGYYISESTRTPMCPEILAACAESRSIPTRLTDNQQIKRLAGCVVEHKKRVFTLPTVMKNQYLIWAHMQRQHGRMMPELRCDCDEILRHSIKVTQAMIEVASMREWFGTAQAMVDFRRCLVQALDVRSSQLLQVPHFEEEHVALCSMDCSHSGALAEFLALGADRRKALLSDAMSPAQLADIEAFCTHVGQAELRARVDVEDESEIVVGDVATCHVLLERKHLRADEAMGPVHAPFFPELKFEEWWFVLVEDAEQPRIVHFERSLETASRIELELRFQVISAGKNSLALHAWCDSYAGLDRRVELTFHASSEDQSKRVYRAHEEDIELDLQPTLFQQWMGADSGRGADDDESDEAEEEPGSASRGTPAWSSRPGVVDDDDSDEAEEEPEVPASGSRGAPADSSARGAPSSGGDESDEPEEEREVSDSVGAGIPAGSSGLVDEPDAGDDDRGGGGGVEEESAVSGSAGCGIPAGSSAPAQPFAIGEEVALLAGDHDNGHRCGDGTPSRAIGARADSEVATAAECDFVQPVGGGGHGVCSLATGASDGEAIEGERSSERPGCGEGACSSGVVCASGEAVGAGDGASGDDEAVATGDVGTGDGACGSGVGCAGAGGVAECGPVCCDSSAAGCAGVAANATGEGGLEGPGGDACSSAGSPPGAGEDDAG